MVADVAGTRIAPGNTATLKVFVAERENPNAYDSEVDLFTIAGDLNLFVVGDIIPLSTGRLIQTGSWPAGASTLDMDLGGVVPGIYQIEVVSGRDRLTVRMIKR